jgi:outer membrane protein insertion porin family
MEAAPISTANVERSKTRINRLGHFDEVNVETPAVPGTTDQVDVKYTVKEKSSGNIAAGAGFSQSQGLVLNANISQNNFLGTGKRVSASFNNSAVNTVYSFAYTNPYYTVDGVSRGFNVSYRTTDAEEANTASYTTDTFAGGVSFGIPINETDRVGLSLGVENTSIDLGSDILSGQIFDFVAANGDSYTNFKISGSWRTDNRNRAVFATRGGSKSLSATATLPGSDLEFIKINYNQKQYFPISRHTTLLLNGELGYGTSYGDTTTLPFFENYFAGGKSSVRGYLDNTLGPRDSLDNVIGGSVKVIGNAEFIFPVPFIPESKTVRLSAFVDGGNVYDDDFVAGELRYSVGVSAKWLSPFGALAVSLAAPLNSGDEDETQAFQFSFGSGI